MLKSKAHKVHVKQSALRNKFVIPALIKLEKSSNYPNIKTVKRVSEVTKVMAETFKLSQDKFVGLVREHALLDENGSIKEKDGQVGTFEIPDANLAAWTTALGGFMDSEAEIVLPSGKLSLDDLAKVGLTPEDLTALSFIVE